MKHRNTDGTWLTLAALGALAVAGATRPRGSRAAQAPQQQPAFPPITRQQVDASITKAKIQELIEATAQEEGHYGKSDGYGYGYRDGQADSFQFNIKASGMWYGMPSWVTAHLGGPQETSHYVREDAQEQLNYFIEAIGNPKSGGWYQPWFTGKWTTAGRSGGYLLLQHDDVQPELEELVDGWEDNVRPILGGQRIDPKFRDEARDVIGRTLDMLRRREALEAYIRRAITDLEQRAKNEEVWQDRLDLSDEEVAQLKAQA